MHYKNSSYLQKQALSFMAKFADFKVGVSGHHRALFRVARPNA